MKKLACVLPLVFVGCATIFTGTKDNVRFSSKPEGATVIVNGMPRGTTPTTIAVERPGLNQNTVVLRKEGYQDVTFVLGKSFNAVSILNFGGLVGWGVDLATGAVMKNDQPFGPIQLTEERRSEVKQQVNVDHVSFSSELPRDANGAIMVASNAPIAVINEADSSVVVFR